MRQRGSVSSHHPLLRNRTESQATMRLRSDSSLTSHSVDEEELIEHSVESRTRIAELPPVMVSGSLLGTYLSHIHKLTLLLSVAQNRRRPTLLGGVSGGLHHYFLRNGYYVFQSFSKPWNLFTDWCLQQAISVSGIDLRKVRAMPARLRFLLGAIRDQQVHPVIMRIVATI